MYRTRQITSGMTLLELMGVMLILALLAGSMILSLDSFVPPAQASRAADEVGQMLQSARMHAIVNRRIVRIEMTPGSSEMALYHEDAVISDTGEPVAEDGPFEIRRWTENVRLVRGLIGQDRTIERDKLVLKFWPNGLCTPVRLYLQHDKGHQRTVRLNPLTGAFRVVSGHEQPEPYELSISDPGVTR